MKNGVPGRRFFRNWRGRILSAAQSHAGHAGQAGRESKEVIMDPRTHGASLLSICDAGFNTRCLQAVDG